METCSEVDDDVDEEDGVREAVEGDPPGAQVVVEEGNGNWKNDEVGHKEQQHAEVPIKPGNGIKTIKTQS